MTRMVFESATLADSIRKAAQIAPRKSGVAFDKASGIVLEVYPGEEVSCIVKATNITLYYSEVVSSIEGDGSATRWRLPVAALEAVMGSLPPAVGKVTFEQTGNKIAISSGRMKASLILMDVEYYPDWAMFDSEDMTSVTSLGGRLEQVEWAASSNADPPFGGVYLNGTHAIATDRYRLASTPLAIDLPRPVILPAGILSGILRKVGDTEVALDNGVLNIAPDPYTQIRTSLFGGDYPPVERVMKRDYPQTVEISKSLLSDVLKRTLAFSGANRDPTIQTFWGKGEVAAMMHNDEIGMLGNVVEVSGQIPHKRCTMYFTPKYLLEALDHAPNDKITISYDDQNTSGIVYINGGSGWESWVSARNKPGPSSDS